MRRADLEGVLRMGIIAVQDILVAHLCTHAGVAAHEGLSYLLDAVECIASPQGEFSPVDKHLELFMGLPHSLPISLLSPVMPVLPEEPHGLSVKKEEGAPCKP